MSDIAIGKGEADGTFRLRTVILILAIGVLGFIGTLVLGAYAPDLRSGHNGGSHALSNAAVGFKTLIQTLAREGKTIVYSSHILDVVERVCDRVIIIDKGRLLLDGKPDELVASHGARTLEHLFTELTGGAELERRAEDFARTFRS